MFLGNPLGRNPKEFPILLLQVFPIEEEVMILRPGLHTPVIRLADDPGEKTSRLIIYPANYSGLDVHGNSSTQTGS
jgi:hypothetical protein